jgi:hypothetical protein
MGMSRGNAARGGVIGLFAALIGCTTTCAPSAWDLDFESSSLESATRAVTIRVRHGTCSAPGGVVESRVLLRGGMHTTPHALGVGPFALEANAVDATCAPIGSACTDLPATMCPAAIHQTLVAIAPGAPECASCIDGVCPDGGDAGLIPDAYVCLAHETSCDDGLDGDCDGRTDCADTECDGLPSACGGLCLGGACCSGCWDGAHCNGGHSRHACGLGGAACVECGSNSCGGDGSCG